MVVFELMVAFTLGAGGGALVNQLVARLRLTPRLDSPWQRRGPQHPPARWDDRLPLLGWVRWRRHAPVYGRQFWWQPFAVELACAVLLAALYYVEVHAGLLWPRVVPRPPLASARAMFGVHAVLVLLLAAASLIDFEEKIIPDAITLPGTLLALVLAVAAPQARLPIAVWSDQQANASPLLLTHPEAWSLWLDDRAGLALGTACFLAWCAALLPREMPWRRGWATALALFVRRLQRDRLAPWIALIAIAGAAGIALVWNRGGEGWRGLLTALVGAAVSGGLVWSMRIIGSWALGREALGFGDVTLMAMVGAFLGWQPATIVFFTAPLLGLAVGVAQWVVHRDPELPYGPYLCLAALLVVGGWQTVWERTEPIFSLGPWLLAVLAVCLLAIYPLLGIVRLILGDPGPQRGHDGE